MSGGKSFAKVFVVLAVLFGFAAGGYYKLEEFSSAKVHEFADRYSKWGQLDFERALINPVDRSLSIWGVRCDFALGSSCTAEKVVVEKLDHEHKVPHFFKGRIEGVSFPVDFMNFGSYASELRKIGYEQLNFDLEAEYIYEDRTRRLSVKKISFDGADTMRFSAGFDLGDLKLQNPGLSGLIGVSMLDGGLVLQDKSLTGKVLNFSAASENLDSDEFRKRLLDGLQLRGQEARSLGNGHAENFYDGLKNFIETPGKLMLRVEPVEPVPLLYIFMGRDFEELLSLYGVTVENDGK